MKTSVKRYVFTAMLFFAFFSLSSQSRSSYFDKPAKIIVPAGYSETRLYPVFVFLPYTTGTAEEFYSLHKEYLPSDVFIVLPQGRPQRSHYLPAFKNYIKWYEKRLLTDMGTLFRNYSIDQTRIVIGGHSLGGDLSWALINRNPEMFSGAVMSGTRASYHTNQQALDILRKKDFKAAFFIGMSEKSVRYKGINNARDELRKAGIETYYKEVNGGHVSGSPSAVAGKMIWALNMKKALPVYKPAEVPKAVPADKPASASPELKAPDNISRGAAIDARMNTGRKSENDISVMLINASGKAVTYLAVRSPRRTALRVVFHGRSKSSPVPAGSHSDIITEEKATLIFRIDGSLKILETPPLKEGMKIILEKGGSLRTVPGNS